MRLLVGFSVGIAVGAGGCYLYLSSVKKPEPRRVGHGIDLEHPALKYGVPETDVVRMYDGYVAAYEYRTRNAKWVIEHLTPASWNGEATRERSEFFPDPGVEPRFSAKLSDFRGSGYDRGHLAPAANHKDSQKAMDETFSLVNISPQVGKGFNRDYWARFEKFVKELTDVAGDVYVVTGPLWLPTQQPKEPAAVAGASASSSDTKWTLKHDWIGKPPGLVAVPTHFYKVVLADTRGAGGSGGGSSAAGGKSGLPRGSVGVGAFVLPNAPIDSRVPLSAYVVPLEDLEQVAGTRFFPELLGQGRRREVLDAAAAGWRRTGMAALKPFERVTLKQEYAALPPPSGAEAAASSSAASAAAAAPPKTAGGEGVVHICEVSGCRLPPPFAFRSDGDAGQAAPAKPAAATRSR